MPTMQQHAAALLLNQLIGMVLTYVQSINQAKQDGVNDLEKWLLTIQGTSMATNMSLVCMMAPKEVLAALPSLAPYVRVVWPEMAASGGVDFAQAAEYFAAQHAQHVARAE